MRNLSLQTFFQEEAMPNFGVLINDRNNKRIYQDEVVDPPELRGKRGYRRKMDDVERGKLTDMEMDAMTHEEVCRAGLRWQSK